MADGTQLSLSQLALCQRLWPGLRSYFFLWETTPSVLGPSLVHWFSNATLTTEFPVGTIVSPKSASARPVGLQPQSDPIQQMPVPGAVSKFLQTNHLLGNWEATSPNIYRWKNNGSRDRTEDVTVFRGTG